MPKDLKTSRKSNKSPNLVTLPARYRHQSVKVCLIFWETFLPHASNVRYLGGRSQAVWTDVGIKSSPILNENDLNTAHKFFKMHIQI